MFTVSLSSAVTKTVRASYTTVDGTALAGEDYVAKSGSVKIAAGKTSTTISIDVSGDTTVEPNESFTVTLSGLKNATFGHVDRQRPPSSTTTEQTDSPGPTALSRVLALVDGGTRR